MILLCWLKCRKNTESKSPRVVNTKNKRTMVSTNCMVCDRKKLKFIKEQETKGPLIMISKIPLLGKLSIH